ncbi:MAG: hypothetical protein FJX77_04250, partial [Armatimonadetes bacterium]|nr:hypothetical protein [Armatimonadota bacterium]
MPGTESTGLTTPPAGGSGQAAAPAPTGATEATGGAAAGGASGSPGKVRVTLDTSLGKIKLELDGDKAPITVKNFVEYVKKGQYDGTIFHRVIPGFMVQGGGFTPELDEKPTGPEIKNEAGNGLKNTRGTIAMART